MHPDPNRTRDLWPLLLCGMCKPQSHAGQGGLLSFIDCRGRDLQQAERKKGVRNQETKMCDPFPSPPSFFSGLEPGTETLWDKDSFACVDTSQYQTTLGPGPVHGARHWACPLRPSPASTAAPPGPPDLAARPPRGWTLRARRARQGDGTESTAGPRGPGEETRCVTGVECLPHTTPGTGI